MATAMGQWRSVGGIRRTSSTEKIRCLVSGFCKGGIANVTFAVSENGGASVDTVVTARDVWVPDDTEITDPLGGALVGPGKLYCYGIELDMATLAQGTIDVTPTINPVSGTSLTLATQRHYNNKTTDTRPNTGAVYVGAGGSDANDGLTPATRVLSLSRAAFKLASGGAMGGGTIYVVGLLNKWQSDSNYFEGPYSSATAEDHWWVHILPEPGHDHTDTFVQYVTPGFDCESANKIDWHFKDLTFIGKGVVFPSHAGKMRLWFEGCYGAPLDAAYGPGQANPHVEAIVQNCSFASASVAAQNDFTWYTGCTWENVVGFITNNTFSNTVVRGFYVKNCAGVALYKTDGSGIFYGPGILEGQRGYDSVKGATDVTGDTNFEIVDNGSGKVRIRSKVANGSLSYINGYTGNFETRFADLVGIGSPQWGCKITGFLGYLDGTYTVLGAGTYGGSNFGYVDIDLVYVADVTGSSGARIGTGTLAEIVGVAVANSLWTNEVHSNGIYTDGTVPTNYCTEDVIFLNNLDARQWVIDTDVSGGSVHRIAIVNCAVGAAGSGMGSGRFEIDVQNGVVDHLYIDHCDAPNFWWNLGATGSFTDLTFSNNIIGGWTLNGALLPDVAGLDDLMTGVADYNHFEDAADAIGAHAQTGATIFSSANPWTTPDFTLNPASNAVGNASDASDIGVYEPVLTGDWVDTPEPPVVPAVRPTVVVVGTGSASSTASMANPLDTHRSPLKSAPMSPPMRMPKSPIRGPGRSGGRGGPTWGPPAGPMKF